MRFLKSLQKREIEELRDDGTARNGSVPHERPTQNGEAGLPGMFKNGSLKIGSPRTEVVRHSAAVTDLLEPAIAVPDVALAETFEARVPVAPRSEVTTVAVDPSQVNDRLIAITQSSSPYCEEYRGLRTRIIQKSKDRKLRSIVIVSVGPSEGKTITAINLAWLLAQTEGIKALVIDGDIRRPSVSSYLGIKTDKGLSDVLSEDAQLGEQLIKLDPSGLHLMPAGRGREDVAELLSGPGFDRLLGEAEKSFEFVIIDAPPLSLFADASIMINRADAALLLICPDQTNYKDIDRLMETLPREKFLGVVMNRSEDALISRQYYKYPYYNNVR